MDPILQLGNAVRVDVPEAVQPEHVHARQRVQTGLGWKRQVDIVLSCTALILVSPLLLVAAALV